MQQNKLLPFENIRKRNGGLQKFDSRKIETAISKAAKASNELIDVKHIGALIVSRALERFKDVPTVEQIQDLVEEVLISENHPKSATAYIVYRRERAKIRDKLKEIPVKARSLAIESKKFFQNPLSEFIYYRTYSRWIEEEGRRETWIETVDRYMNFMKENLEGQGTLLTEQEYDEVKEAILNQRVMPSMRLLWSAGRACRKNNFTAYNCSFIRPESIDDFAEIMYLSMCGTGVGYSVEAENVSKLPVVEYQTGELLPTHAVADSKEGWGDALKVGMRAWFSGKDIGFDYSNVRPAGARLKTMGGQSSGWQVLKDLLEFVRSKILAAQGRKLRPIEVHDVICKIGEVVVMGGVRRSAMISLSDLVDEEMRHAKTGAFYINESQRSMANNSAVYVNKPTAVEFLEEWTSLAKSGTGERGIFNRGNLQFHLPPRRVAINKNHLRSMGTNPCGEICLRSKQLCNLTEVVCRSEDTLDSLMDKIRIATLLGTYQSSLTKFPYVSDEWKKNCEEERLLGVSLTGVWDCPLIRDESVLSKLRQYSVFVNEQYARILNISPSTCITCVKPSGTVSQLVNSASGMHPRHSQYYIRRVRISATDPLFHMIREQKYPFIHPEVGQGENASTYVLEFPVKAPDGSVTRDKVSALELLEFWKTVKKNFTEHNPSATISIGKEEWIPVCSWLYSNWNIIGGLSFLPREEHAYQLAPYEDITREQYDEMVARLPPLDYAAIMAYEKEDTTSGAKELACSSGICTLDDAPKR